MWESRVDTRYDMKTDLNFHNLSNLFIIYFIVTKFVVVHIFDLHVQCFKVHFSCFFCVFFLFCFVFCFVVVICDLVHDV